ncbi:NAD(P)H-dependent oxidoreductase subunit E [Bacteroidota bacterium]
MEYKFIKNFLNEHKNNGVGIISILQYIQSKYGYLPKEALIKVAEETGKSLVDIYGVATFYKSFSLNPKGKHHVTACLGTACHVRGGPDIAAEFEKILNIRPGETTPDEEFSFDTVSCLGACALGPIVVVDGQYYSKVDRIRVKNIIKEVKESTISKKDEIKPDEKIFPVEASCYHCNHSMMDPNVLIDNYPSIWVTISFKRQHGWLRLSSLYGSPNVKSDCVVPDDTLVNFFCPHCHSELRGANICNDCGAPMVLLLVKGGGIVQICSRQSCKSHMLELSDVNI